MFVCLALKGLSTGVGVSCDNISPPPTAYNSSMCAHQILAIISAGLLFSGESLKNRIGSDDEGVVGGGGKSVDGRGSGITGGLQCSSVCKHG